MKSASTALKALLDKQTFLMADLYTIVLAGGGAVYFTTWETDLSYGGNTFSSVNSLVQRGSMRCTVGLEVETMDVTLSGSSSFTLNGVSIPAFAVNGGFDNASILLQRMFMATPGDTSAGAVTLFSGRVADIEINRMQVTLACKSWTDLFTQQYPRNLYQAPCNHQLYDAGCAISKAAYKSTFTVNSGSTPAQILCGSTQAADYFSLGYLQFTSGPNAGAWRTVGSDSPGVLNLVLPLYAPPAAGDAFDVYAGCDHTMAICASKFNNLPNFKGMPFIPQPETAW